MPGGEERVDETSAIQRGGGVKALLKQLNNKYGDSHVQLPDGTVPTKKTFVPKTPAAPARTEPTAQDGQDGSASSKTSPPKGVRAMLQKEVKTSFVKLPDGSTPAKKLSVKKRQDEEGGKPVSSDDDYEPARVVNLQELDYDEQDKITPPSVLPTPMTQQQELHRHVLSQNVMSDYPAPNNHRAMRPRQLSPPVLSDYPPAVRTVQREQLPNPMNRVSRPANAAVQSNRGPPYQDHGPTEGRAASSRVEANRVTSLRDHASADGRAVNSAAHINRISSHNDHIAGGGQNKVWNIENARMAIDASINGEKKRSVERVPLERQPQLHPGHNVEGSPQRRLREQMGPEEVYNQGTYKTGAKVRDKDDLFNRENLPNREMIREQHPITPPGKVAPGQVMRVSETARESVTRDPMVREIMSREPAREPHSNGVVVMGNGREVIREPPKEQLRREIKVIREREHVIREREIPREREPIMEKGPDTKGREPARDVLVRVKSKEMLGESMAKEPAGGREGATRESAVRDTTSRDAMNLYGPTQVPAPPPLLPGQGPKPVSIARNGYPGGSTAPDPPNLLPSAKVQDFRTVQQQRSPQAIPRSPSGPSRDLHRLENQPEQAGRTQAGPNHARINDWIEQAYPQPSNPKSKSINDWIEQAYPRQGNPQAKAKEFVQSVASPLQQPQSAPLSPMTSREREPAHISHERSSRETVINSINRYAPTPQIPTQEERQGPSSDRVQMLPDTISEEKGQEIPERKPLREIPELPFPRQPPPKVPEMPFERQPPRDSSDLSGNQFEERQFEERQPPWENPEMVVEKALDDLALVSEKALDDLALANETLVSMPSTKLKGERYGIGVKFQRLESGCMEVVGLVSGCTGAESGLIFVGDVLRFVDGVDVTRTVQPEFEELLAGENGSTVTLSFGKPGSKTSALVHVAVSRGPESPPSQTSAHTSAPASEYTESSLSSLPTAVSNATTPSTAQVLPAPFSPPAAPAQSTPVPTPVKPPPSSMPRVLVPKVIHTNPVNMHQIKASRAESTSREQTFDNANRDSTFSANIETSEKLVGVGIVFNVDGVGALRVKHLIPGGPAAMSSEIVLGDVLCEIDSIDVYRKSVEQIQDVVMGPKDSVVTLGLKNPASMDGPVRQVHLFRRFDVNAMDTAQPSFAPVSYSKVIDMLYLGDAETSRNIGLMKDLGINCIVNVAMECENLFEADFIYSNITFENHHSALLRNGFDEACDVIARNMQLGLTTIVHCSDGNNRSATFCVAYLMRKKRATLKQAWNLVKNVRPTVSLFHSFFQQLLEYEWRVNGSNTMLETDVTFADSAQTVV